MKTFVIAEFGMLHDGSFGNAVCMAQVARDCGADAVKFQTHISEAETLPDAPMPAFFKGEPRWDYFKRTAFNFDQWKKLKEHCDKIGIEFMSSPFSVEAVDLLERIGMKRYKIPSGEVTNIPFLERVAKTGGPVLLSSGMSDWEELDSAVDTIKKYNKKITMMQCTSMYPTPPEKVGLNVLAEMKERYGFPVGLSDQSLTISSCIAAVCLGATVIEKHVTLSKNCYGSDAKHSIEPERFAGLVKSIREIEKMLENPVDKNDLSSYLEMKRVFEKSVVSLREIAAGEKITRSVIGLRKPGGGISPNKFDSLIGHTAKRKIPANKIISESDIT